MNRIVFFVYGTFKQKIRVTFITLLITFLDYWIWKSTAINRHLSSDGKLLSLNAMNPAKLILNKSLQSTQRSIFWRMSAVEKFETGLFDNKHRKWLLLFRKEYHQETEGAGEMYKSSEQLEESWNGTGRGDRVTEMEITFPFVTEHIYNSFH